MTCSNIYQRNLYWVIAYVAEIIWSGSSWREERKK